MNPSRRRTILAGALVVVLVLAVYIRVLDAPFVSDDRAIVLGDALGRPPGVLGAFWVRTYFRPLTMASFRLDALLHGDDPFGFHLTNLALHAVNVALLIAWMRRLGAALLATCLATLLWALHPSTSETVCWVSARGDALALAFVLSAALVWPEGSKDRAVRVVVASALVFLGLLAKEVAFVAIPMLAVRGIFAEGTSRREVLARAWPLGAVGLMVLGLRESALAGSAPLLVARGPQPWLTLATLGTYARVTLALHPANVIGLPTEIDPAMVVLGVLVAATAAASLAVFLRRRDAGLVAAWTLAVVALVPVLHIVRFPSHTLVADRYLYAPLAGVAATVALLGSYIGRRSSVLSSALAMAAVGLVGFVTWWRVDDWRDEVRFWLVSARDASPRDRMPLANLATVLAREQRCDRALLVLTPLTRLGAGNLANDEYDHVQQNAVACLSHTGAHAEALALARALVAREPHRPLALRSLGVAAMSAQRFDEARAAFERLVALDPSSNDARDWLALAAAGPTTGASTGLTHLAWLQRIGAEHEAETAWREALTNPQLPPGVALLGAEYLVQRGSVESARLALAHVEASDAGAAGAAGVRDAIESRARVDREIDGASGLLDDLVGRISP